MKIKMEEILRSLNSFTRYKFYKHVAKYNRQRSEKNILSTQVRNIVSKFAKVSVSINNIIVKLIVIYQIELTILLNGMKACIAMVSKNVK